MRGVLRFTETAYRERLVETGFRNGQKRGRDERNAGI